MVEPLKKPDEDIEAGAGTEGGEEFESLEDKYQRLEREMAEERDRSRRLENELKTMKVQASSGSQNLNAVFGIEKELNDEEFKQMAENQPIKTVEYVARNVFKQIFENLYKTSVANQLNALRQVDADFDRVYPEMKKELEYDPLLRENPNVILESYHRAKQRMMGTIKPTPVPGTKTPTTAVPSRDVSKGAKTEADLIADEIEDYKNRIKSGRL